MGQKFTATALGINGDSGLPITITVEDGNVHITGALSITAEIPVSIRYSDVRFTSALCDQPSHTLEVAISQESMIGMTVAAGIKTPENGDAAPGYKYPYLDFTGEKRKKGLVLVCEANEPFGKEGRTHSLVVSETLLKPAQEPAKTI
jgi:hypothetical protein